MLSILASPDVTPLVLCDNLYAAQFTSELGAGLGQLNPSDLPLLNTNENC